MAENELEVQERDPWDQQEGEPSYWYTLFSEYRFMGPTRNLRKFYRQKRDERGLAPMEGRWGSPSNWSHYFRDWKWKERAEAWDESLRDLQETQIEAVLGEGVALAHNRIEKLKMIAAKLEETILDPSNKRVSPYVIEQYRGVLDDIAKEKGERVKVNVFSGAGGGPIKIETEWGRGGSASNAWDQKALPAPIEATIIEETHEND